MGSVSAQPFPELPSWTAGPGTRSHDYAVLDFEGDGDLDLFIADLAEVRFYRNDDGQLVQQGFSGVPFPHAIAAGDLDGDGYPDAVVATSRSLTVLRNILGAFLGSGPAVDVTENATDLALADIDGDGDLDVIAANDGPNTVASNADAVLTPETWTSERVSRSHAVAIADVDGDGWPDVFFANQRENTLYLNQNGVLPTLPSWTSTDTSTTVAVALGDVDGDGDLDAICANSSGTNAIYENLGQTFSLDPVYLASGPSLGVAVADLDGDEDLDVVFGNAGFNVAYENVGGNLDGAAPVWTSEFLDVTTSVGLIDLDDFGGPDLLCINTGQQGQSDVLYHHRGLFFSSQPIWTSPGPDRDTRAVAVGDLDNDGDPDVVFGNGLAPNNSDTVYHNEGGQLVLEWTEPASEARQTSSVALGFVDEDEYPDLVTGSANDAQITVYTRPGGMFPAVASQRILGPRSAGVLMTELFGGGPSELVSANLSQSGGSTVYQISGQLFDEVPVWTSLDGFDSRAVASADFDRDGDLDLVFANLRGVGQANSIYMNDAGQLEGRSSWMSEPVFASQDVATADFDGDGYPDLVFANWVQSDTVYLNSTEQSGGLILFDPKPTWALLAQTATYCVATGDLDADGDADLVFGNAGPDLLENTAYSNLARGNLPFLGFGLAPAWSSGEQNLTVDVALVDLDEDGDLDLICANSGANTIYDGRRNHDPSRNAGIHGVATSAGMLRRVRVSPTGEENIYEVVYEAIDAQGDPLNIGVEYGFAGSTDWMPATLGVGEDNPQLSIATSAQGIAGSFLWDVSRMPFDDREVVLRLKTTETSIRIAGAPQARSYLETVGTIMPVRPVIHTDSEQTFPPVGLGEAAEDSFEVRNHGTKELTIDHVMIDAMSDIIAINEFPVRIDPRASKFLKLRHVPLQPSQDDAILEIRSNDPLNERVDVVIHLDARPLTFSVESDVVGVSAPLGEDLVFSIVPAEHVVIDGGHLFHRSRDATAFEDSVALELQNDTWIATVRGDFIKESGLAYYARVYNDGFSATLPADAPLGFMEVDVLPPRSFDAVAVSDPDGVFAEGDDVSIELDLPRGTEFGTATLFYRAGGQAAYNSAAVERGPNPGARIPGAVVDARGLEYWVTMETATGTHLTDPPEFPSERPRIIQIDVASLREPTTHVGLRYRMVSIPLVLGAHRSIHDILADQGAFGPYQTQPPRNWRAFRYLAAQGAAVEFDPEAAEPFELEPGRGFWLISRSAHSVDTAPVNGRSVRTDAAYPIVLPARQEGQTRAWAQIGNPFAFPVAWETVERSTSVNDPVAFDSSLNEIGDYAPDDVVVLMPFEAYFIANSSSEPETLLVYPTEASETLMESVSPLGTLSSAGRSRSSEDGWSMSVTARAPRAVDSSLRFGVRGDARTARDGYDRLKPPPAPGPWVRIAFPHEDWGRDSGDYRTDFRGPRADGHRWDVVVRTKTRDEEVVLEGWSQAQLPEDRRLVLVDLELGSRVDLTDAGFTHRLVSFGPSRPYRLAVVVGTEDYVDREAKALVQIPTRLVLAQNTPNPFNPSTRIRFGLPRPSRVRLDVYNIRGERILALLDDEELPAGYHAYVWDGRDHRGHRVSSGVYLYRLVTEEKALSRKMVLTQ